MKTETRRTIDNLVYFMFCVITAMIGHTIHQSDFWAVMDFLFAPFAWFKWFICQEVNISIIKETFSWFFK